MLVSIVTLLLSLLVVFLFLMVIRPYFQISSLKKSFQKQGLKVKILRINFFKDGLIDAVQADTQNHSDAVHFMKKDLQGYDIAIMNIFNKIVLVTCSIEILKQSYKQIERLEKNDLFEKNFGRLFGGGIVMQEGKVWKEKRKLYSEIFNYSLLEDIFPTLCQSIEHSISSWEGKDEIDCLAAFQSMFFRSFIISYFGQEFESFSYKGKSYEQSLVKLFSDAFYQSFTFRNMAFGPKFLQKGYTETDRQINEDMEVVKEATKSFVKLKYHQFLKNELTTKNTIIFKIFSKLKFEGLSEQQKEELLESITGDVAIFFFAGTDTSAGTLAALLHKISESPETIQKIRSQFASAEDSLTFNKAKELKYMEAVINQTLRLYGPANWIFVREIKQYSEETKIGNTALPKGSFLLIQSNTVHCNPEFYEKPQQFKPERWLNRNSENHDPYSFVAFGAGQRNCIGQHLARAEMKIALGKVVSKFDFKLKGSLKMGLPFIYCSLNNEMKVTPRK